MSNPTYNSNSLVYSLADAVGQSSDVKAKIWEKMLQVGTATADDFSRLEGAAESKMPFWKKTQLNAGGGDKVIFNTIGDASGPGARGEVELTGRTSKPRMGAYTCQVDFWRDAVEVTKKELKFLAAGASLETVLLKMLSAKLGRKRMYDMMHALKRTTNAQFLRPNARTSRDTIISTDTLSTSFLVDSKALLQGIGARPIESRKSSITGGAPIWRYLAFIGQDAMRDIRNDTAYLNACNYAAERDTNANPLFSGALPDWQGMLFWEHTVVDPDSNDTIGSPIAPKAKLGVAITAATTTFILKSGSDGLDTLCEYFRDFPGYDYLFTEDQVAAPDSTVYYFWVYNHIAGPGGSNAGKWGFYSYTGSDNNGNQIVAIAGRLRAAASGIAVTTLGNVVWDASTMTDNHPVGATIIPANANGVPIAENFILGAGCALRAYGSTDIMIKQDRDYGFVQGMGYEGVWGQRAALDTQSVPRGYVVLQTAFEHPGLTPPFVA